MRNHYLCVILVEIFAMFQNSAQEDPCKHVADYLPTFSRCCDLPEIELTDSEKVIIDDCHKSVRKKYSDLREMEKEECAEECYFLTAELMTPDMKPKEMAIVASYEKAFQKYPMWEEPIIKAIEQCAKIDFKQPKSKCKSGALEFSYCMERKMFVKCPEGNFNGIDDECLETKQMFEKCDVTRRRYKKKRCNLRYEDC